MKAPILVAVIVTLSCWLVVSLACEVALRVTHLQDDRLIGNLADLIGFLGAAVGWEWMHPVRDWNKKG